MRGVGTGVGMMNLSEHSDQLRDGHGIICIHSCGLCPPSNQQLKQLQTSGPPFSTKDRAHALWVPATRSTLTGSVRSIPAGLSMSASGVGGPIPDSNVPHVSVPLSPILGVDSGSKSVVPSPGSPKVLQEMLNGYDNLKSIYLFNGFTVGFSIGCLGIPVQRDTKVVNMKSAFQFPSVIEDRLTNELALGRILGPFTMRPTNPGFRVSPLGVVPKKLPGEFRMIHNLSYPPGESVNNYIPAELTTVHYATIQNAISFMKSAQSIVFMAKVDIESAFRIIPVAPNDTPLLGFCWRDKYYMDAVLPMGCASSCAIFESFSTAVQWVAEHKLGLTKVIHVLDDVLVLAESKEKCERDLHEFMNMCQQLGVPLAPAKTVGPCTTIQFLGITIDTVAMEARLPNDKLDKGRLLICSFLAKHKVTLREAQSLAGLLEFMCCVIRFARAFSRRLIDLTLGVTKPNHHIRLTRQVKMDLLVWQEFLDQFNGKSFFVDDIFLTGDYLQLFTDAAGGIGYGAVCGHEWFFGKWPLAWLAFNITVLELYPIMTAVEIWGKAWMNSSVCFFTDNEALVSVINKQSSREPAVMMLLRKLILTCLRYNINFTARHVPGRDNTLADKLSRSQILEFRALAPWANSNPATVPPHLCPESLLIQ